MARLVRPYLDDILEAIAGIDAAMAGKTPAEYAEDWLLRHGVERAVEIISEASRGIPQPLRALRPEIPWSRVSGIGNVLRHEYKRVADAAIFELVRRDLPPLKAAVLAIEASLDEPEE